MFEDSLISLSRLIGFYDSDVVLYLTNIFSKIKKKYLSQQEYNAEFNYCDDLYLFIE